MLLCVFFAGRIAKIAKIAILLPIANIANRSVNNRQQRQLADQPAWCSYPVCGQSVANSQLGLTGAGMAIAIVLKSPIVFTPQDHCQEARRWNFAG
jgi:hypothetical protein